MMTSSKVAFATPSFDGVDRCRFLLETWAENDPHSFGLHPHVICADFVQFKPLREMYGPLSTTYPHVETVYRDTTGCCDGASRTAIEYAITQYDPKWVVLLSDDLAVTPGAISSLLYFLYENPLDTIGGIQPPYWHCTDELDPNSPYFPKISRRDFYAYKDWTRDAPRNPFFERHSAFPYFSVHGSSMVVRADTYKAVGGIPYGSWRYDETLSYFIWTRSQQSIVALPGPPLVHYMGGGFEKGPEIDWQMGNETHFQEATGATLQEAQATVARIQAERTPAIEEEMQRCRYWDTREEVSA